MSIDITVNLSEAVRHRAELWAEQAGRSLPDFLAQAIETSLLPLGNLPPPVESWSDEELLVAADAHLSLADDSRLSELLASQREDTIQNEARGELARLMQVYQEGLVRKAAATD